MQDLKDPVSNGSRWVTEGIALALLPALGYYFVFQYESGYASYFNYPKELIEIGLPQIVIAAGALWIAAVVIFFIFEAITLAISETHRAFYGSIFRLLPFAGFILCQLLAYGWSRTWPVLIIFVLIAFIEFVFPVFNQKGKKDYSEKIQADWDKEWELRQIKNTLSWQLVSRFGHKTISTVINVIIFALFLHSAGEVAASKQISFFTIPSAADKVILKIYGDKLVCAQVDRTTKIIKKEVFLYLMADSDVKSFKLEDIGPLRREK